MNTTERLLKERQILLDWYLKTLENYDGLTSREELEREVLLELEAAVDKES